MCLTKSIYVNLKVDKSIFAVFNDYKDKNVIVSLLDDLNRDIIDDIVCKCVYFHENKGPKMMDELARRADIAATSRFASVLYMQSQNEPLVLNDSVTFELDVLETIQCFATNKCYQQNISTLLLDSISKGKTVSFNTDDLLMILHNSMVDTMEDNDYINRAKELIVDTANLADLSKAIKNIKDVVGMLSAKCTYLNIAKSIENTSIFKSLVDVNNDNNNVEIEES